MRLTFRRVRDAVLLVGGFLLLGHETIFVPEPRTALLLVATGMLGIPAALGADNLFVRNSEAAPPSESEEQKPSSS